MSLSLFCWSLSYSYWYILRFPDARTATNRLTLFFYPSLDSCGIILRDERSAQTGHTISGFPSWTDCIHRSCWEIRNLALPQLTADCPEGITEEMPAVMRRPPGNCTTILAALDGGLSSLTLLLCGKNSPNKALESVWKRPEKPLMPRLCATRLRLDELFD